MNRRASLVALVAVSALAIGESSVDLSVRDHSGVARTGVPVRGGVPFPRGVLKACTGARLHTDTGEEVPCQVRPIAHWYDGSIKWLLVDTRVDVPANGTVRLRLEPSVEPAAVKRTLRVTEDPDHISVDCGPARFAFSKKGFGLPAAAWADLDGDGVAETQVVEPPGDFVCEVEHQAPGSPQEENWLRDAAGASRERFIAAAAGDCRAEVESASDLRAVVKLSGWLVNDQGRRLIQYVVRAHACAARPELRIFVTFVYAGDPKQDFIRTMHIDFPRASSGPAVWAFGGAERHEGRLAASDSVNLSEIGPEKIYHLSPYTQDKSVAYSVSQDGKEVAKGKHAAGWARVADERSSMQLAVRNFWQMHPKELKAGREGLRFYIWPESGGKVLDLRRRSDEIDNVYHYDLSLWPYGGEGVAVTHELMLRVGPPAEDTAAEMTATLNAPLLLHCTPAYYAATNAFGPFAVADPVAYPHFEALQNIIVEWIRANQRAFHWDGMIDYGDTFFHGYGTRSHYGYVCKQGWCSRGYVGWLCNDGTLTNSLFLQYLRTGDYRTFLTAEAMARHVMDVDTCHYCSEAPGHVGGGHRHDQQHWGNGVRGYGTATHGSIDYYLLTGDERALDVAHEYAKYHTDGIPAENEDRIGGLIRMWEITGDAALKAKADQLLAAELNVPADREWPFVTRPHFRFVSNTSVSLLHYLYSAPPNDAAKLRRAIVKAMAAREQKYMRSWEDTGYLTLIMTALAYQVTDDARYARLTAALLQPSRNFTPRRAEVPADLTGLLRGLDFEGVRDMAFAWQVNNIYIANIKQLCPLPYALAALNKAGMDEAAVYNAGLDTSPPPPFEEVLDPKAIRPWGPVKGRPSSAYSYRLSHGSPSDKGGGRSQLVLMEDGRPLKPRQAHLKIMHEGKGLFSHWGARGLIFSSSDNSDPRTNGREYKAVLRGGQ